MSGVNVRVTVRGMQEANVALEEAILRGKDLTPAMKKAQTVMLSSVNQNFQRSGRPRPWRPLKDTTLRQKLRAGYTYMPLIRTGQLKRSIAGTVRGSRLVVGTAVKYGRWLQEGTSKMVARPYLLFQRQDLQDIQKILVRHVTGKRTA